MSDPKSGPVEPPAQGGARPTPRDAPQRPVERRTGKLGLWRPPHPAKPNSDV